MSDLLSPELIAVAYDVAPHCLWQFVVFFILYGIVRAVWTDAKEPISLADTFICGFIYPALVWYTYKGAFGTYHDLDSRWFLATEDTKFFLQLYVSRCIVHCGIQSLQKMTLLQFCLMTAHHMISITCYTVALVTGRAHFWACLDGCCEISNIFLTMLYYFKDVTIKGKALQTYCPNWVYALNGLGLWLSFLFARLLLFPSWLYFWWKDISDNPEATWDKCNILEKTLHPAATLFLLILSITWFIPVSRGLFKAVFSKGDDGFSTADNFATKNTKKGGGKKKSA